MKKHVQRLMSISWVAAALLLPAVGEAENLSDWAHSTSLVFSGYAGTTALTNFPAFVRLSEGAGGFSYADCRADGSDIRFSLGNGVALPHQRAAWNPSGASEYWIRIPVLAGTATTIFVHWGNPAAAAEPRDRVWDDSYRGVWTLDGASGQIVDASRHGHDGTGVFSATDRTGRRRPRSQVRPGHQRPCGHGLCADAFPDELHLRDLVPPGRAFFRVRDADGEVL